MYTCKSINIHTSVYLERKNSYACPSTPRNNVNKQKLDSNNCQFCFIVQNKMKEFKMCKVFWILCFQSVFFILSSEALFKRIGIPFGRPRSPPASSSSGSMASAHSHTPTHSNSHVSATGSLHVQELGNLHVPANSHTAERGSSTSMHSIAVSALNPPPQMVDRNMPYRINNFYRQRIAPHFDIKVAGNVLKNTAIGLGGLGGAIITVKAFSDGDENDKNFGNIHETYAGNNNCCEQKIIVSAPPPIDR